MKYFLSAILIFFISKQANTQSVGIGTATPNASARLDVSATNKGLLIPRVALTSATDVVTISNPAISLLVYNTSSALDSAGYYYWSGAKWLKLINTGAAAGGDLSGTYPNPNVTALNGIPIPTTPLSFNDGGKTLRYDPGVNQYVLQNPVQYGEAIYPGFVGINGNGNLYPPRLIKAGDNANMMPVAYGTYNAVTNTTSGMTANVTFTRLGAGNYTIDIDPNSVGLLQFNPVTVCTVTDYGLISASFGGGYRVNITAFMFNGFHTDLGFSFIIYNR